MINTRIIEVVARGDTTEEVELGYCSFPEVPIEKKSPLASRGGEAPPPFLVRINGAPFFVIGHSWEITTADHPQAIEADAEFVMVVQKVPTASTIIQPGDVSAMDKLRNLALDLKK